MSQYVVIATSPTHETSVACGPYRTVERADKADAEMTYRGWNTEGVSELLQPEDLPYQDWTDGENG